MHVIVWRDLPFQATIINLKSTPDPISGIAEQGMRGMVEGNVIT